jgi:hypothetical protein
MNLIEDKLSLVGDYLFSISRDKTDVNLGSALTASSAFPDAVSRTHNVRLDLEYALRDDLSMKLGYLWEKYSLGDWAYQNVFPNTIGEIIATGMMNPDYKAHLVTWSFVYRF